MNLISVYDRSDRHELLYRLLGEREQHVNISHKAMPCMGDHIRFVESRPYEAWYFICDPDPVGACYLTRQNEIGIFIFAEHQKKGYGRQGIQALMTGHGPRRYLANIAPGNVGSRAMFGGLGFKLVQYTYALEG